MFLPSSSGDGSLDRLLQPVSTGLSPRKRTTSQCKSEPPLLRTSKRTIYTAGRPPWYNEHGTQSKEAFAIGETDGKIAIQGEICRLVRKQHTTTHYLKKKQSENRLGVRLLGGAFWQQKPKRGFSLKQSFVQFKRIPRMRRWSLHVMVTAGERRPEASGAGVLENAHTKGIF